jgi:hypothetical protein
MPFDGIRYRLDVRILQHLQGRQQLGNTAQVFPARFLFLGGELSSRATKPVIVCAKAR